MASTDNGLADTARLREALERWHSGRGRQKAFAEAVGVSEQAVSRWLREGCLDRPALLAAAKVLGVGPAWLAGFDERATLPVIGSIGGPLGDESGQVSVSDVIERLGGFAVHVASPDYEPRYRVGELIWATEDQAPQGGDDVLIELLDGEVKIASLVHADCRGVMLTGLDGGGREWQPRQGLRRCALIVGRLSAAAVGAWPAPALAPTGSPSRCGA